MPHSVALIVAAGSGERFGGAVPKQYRDLAGIPILRRSVLAYRHCPSITSLRVVINPEHRSRYEEAVAGLDLPPPVAGGRDRQSSVLNGLEALAQERAPDRVLIHDAVRPLVQPATIEGVVRALDNRDGAIAAVPVTDTLKRGEDRTIVETVERAGLWRAQTPQGFRFAPILAAHRETAGIGLTDDAALFERSGRPVALVPGSEDNLKVTTEDDLHRAERLLGRGGADIRTGSGFDVHRFGAGDHVMLCGVRIPHPHGLMGHSDADVGLHALTDALLGAVAAGDIGQHFPPSDERWRGAASDRFVRHAANLVRRMEGDIRHVDVTLICQSPKIGPHRDAMRDRLADLLGIARDRVSVKATTTEGLGFAGRGEGIAAQAIATVALPL